MARFQLIPKKDHKKMVGSETQFSLKEAKYLKRHKNFKYYLYFSIFLNILFMIKTFI